MTGVVLGGAWSGLRHLWKTKVNQHMEACVAAFVRMCCSVRPCVCFCPGVLLVYFSGYLIEATGSWASVFALISTVNVLGLCTFLAFAEARRMDIDCSKVRHHNIHI